MTGNNYNIRWMAKVDGEIAHLKDIIENHVMSQLKEIKSWMWKLVFVIIASVLIPLGIAIILKVLRII